MKKLGGKGKVNKFIFWTYVNEKIFRVFFFFPQNKRALCNTKNITEILKIFLFMSYLVDL